MMEKLTMQTPDFTEDNIAKLAQLFPNCVTETMDEKGAIKKAIDFEQLKQQMSSTVVEGHTERFHLSWPGKNASQLMANTPIHKALRPVRAESVDFDSTENLFIEGDNLDALKLLQETYLAKVKMIYIDPPYNTGKDFVYNDKFAVENKHDYLVQIGAITDEGHVINHDLYKQNMKDSGRFHSDWLSMMYPRLKLARNLLRDDGVIFISIDDGEQANLKRMCDEIFGEDNFVANLIWEKKYAPQNDAKFFATNHDYVLCFARQKDKWKRILLPRTAAQNKAYKNPDNDPRGVWQSDNLTAARLTEKDVYPIVNPQGTKIYPPKGRSWLFSKEKFQGLLNDNRIWFAKNKEAVPRYKRFLSEVQNGTVPQTIMPYSEVGHTQAGAREVKNIFEGNSFFSYPKPTTLIKRFLQLVTKDNDIILDFFAGSGTTAHAVMNINAADGGKRRFIMVQLAESLDEETDAFKVGFKTIADVSKKRIRLAGIKIVKENSDAAKNLDTGFRTLKVDSSNMADVYYVPDNLAQESLAFQADNIKTERSQEDLLFQVLLDWGVDLTLPIQEQSVLGLSTFFVNDLALVACFDKQGRVNEDYCREIASKKPMRVVFRDSGFANDGVKINIEQIFKHISPSTDIKTL